MTKRKATDVLLLLACCIPWAFLGMYADSACHLEWSYLPALLLPAAAGTFLGRTRPGVATAAGLVSCAASCLLACQFLRGEGYYFKPLGLIGMALLLSAIPLSGQLLAWKWLRKDKTAPLAVQFFEVLAMLFLGLLAIAFVLLLLARILI